MSEAFSTVGLLVGYTMLNAAARGGSAVSQEARAVQCSAFAVVAKTEQSIALFGEKANAISQVWSLASECAEGDWNGEGAEAIDQIAATLAIDFIRALPDRMSLPESSPEPDGAISLDWIESRHRLFSISVGPRNRIAYAWIDGSDRGHGVASFDGETIPPRILQGITEIIRNDASVRAA